MSLNLAYDDSIFSGPIIPMDLNPVESESWLFDQAVLPETTEADAPALDFEDESDDIFSSNPSLNVAPLEGSFQLADCSSEGLFAPGISRVRRGAGSGFCSDPSPAAGAQPSSADGRNSDMIDLPSLLRSDDIEDALKVHFGNEERNSFCYWYSSGQLPWGVCGSGNPADETNPSPSTPQSGDWYITKWIEYIVLHGKLRKLV